MYVVGLMSGTSGDGVDAALVKITGRAPMLVFTTMATYAVAYPRVLQRRILAVAVSGSVAEVCHLNAELGEWLATAAARVIQRAKLRPAAVALIGSHGQTVHHLPNGVLRSTLQIGEPAIIAERTGITTIANFRARDLAAGGHGAPLTPLAHALLLSHPTRARLIVNLGGISNVTYVPRGGRLSGVRAFDTGPANMVLDSVVAHATAGRQGMDRHGRRAWAGKVDAKLLATLLAHPFLAHPPPKSTGRESFGPVFLDTLLRLQRQRRLSTEDLLATCSLWAARAVASAQRWIPGTIAEVVVGGGGVRNRALMRDLRTVFAPIPVTTFDAVGGDSTMFEAVAMAVLAYYTATGRCSNLPAVTGARHPVVLGTIVPNGPHWARVLRAR